ncbi:MAG: alkaline phosphatase [Armatimonadetes bacterium]|nr:alkaline phosphatase [Armatimonadota bacterium]
MRNRVLTIFLLLILACGAWAAPKNIILMIGDGMGLAHVAAARTVSVGPGGRLAMDAMPVVGFVTTHSVNALITDSAAAATAYATGVKTNNGVIGQAPDGRRLKSLLEVARELGKSTGLVTTTSITDATPASFAAHIDSRSKQAEIAGQLLASRVDVLLGGGRDFFASGAGRPDGRNLLRVAAARGYTVVGTTEELDAADGPKLLGLFAPGNLVPEASAPPLSVLTAKAIKTLSQSRHGFFLMVEGGLIDIYSHRNDLDQMVDQLLEFDRAAAVALDFARQDKETLVVITADHETGGLTLLADDSGRMKPAWSTKGHTGAPVPICAFGPGCEQFAGILDNTDVNKRLGSLWGYGSGLESPPSRAEKPAASPGRVEAGVGQSR